MVFHSIAKIFYIKYIFKKNAKIGSRKNKRNKMNQSSNLKTIKKKPKHILIKTKTVIKNRKGVCRNVLKKKIHRESK